MTESGGTSPGTDQGSSAESSYGEEPASPTHGTSGSTPGTSGTYGASSDAGRSESGREWLSQLQSMIDNLATQAGPVLRQVGAKAAELAAAAGDKAGPIAHKAADATEAAGAKLAERGREVAAELRRDGEGEGAAAGDMPNAIEPGPGASSDPANPRPGITPDSADTLGE